MILAAHSDASYLSEPKARSRAGGHIFLSENVEDPPNNGAILTIAQIIKNVMTSATEAELAALYIVAKECVYIRIILEEMGHKQPPRPSKPTTPRRKASSTARSSQSEPKQWTCASTGSATAKHFNNSESIGAPAVSTSLTTSPNTTALHITSASDPLI
ncbi:hypothetical protein THAOC_08442 [Thalassiosira oceanica]|uniref:Uncharacterized protein n=1 Tax=Thalassiosira oceanica TaxID=159749 RepID=K0TI77_THAOC|nr:hypothetical protein THAOC_08442 [Thalassiosira oceanica]|eukprot:EJK70217.1 hypothetical protein THAOC_08442 [Thalassiosira oceanica]